MADLTFNTPAGQTIDRELIIAYLNTGSTSSPTWSPFGKRVEDSSAEYDWSEETVRDILGSKPEAVEDPRRMEKNVFYIQVNNGTNQQLNIPLDTIRSLSADDRRIILENMSEPLDEADADQIFDS